MEAKSCLRKACRSLARKFHPEKVSPCLAATPMGIFSDVPSSTYLTMNASVYRTLLVENNSRLSKRAMNGTYQSLRAGRRSKPSSRRGPKMARAEATTISMNALAVADCRCRRSASDLPTLRRRIYPAYDMLLLCLEMPASCKEAMTKDDSSLLLFTCLLPPKRAEFVLTTVA